MLDQYKIEGCEHNDRDRNQEHLNDPTYYPDFQIGYTNFKQLVISCVESLKPTTIIHFGDGDYYFLKGISLGSAAPGRRALSIPYDKIDLTKFYNGFLQNTYFCLEAYEKNNKSFIQELYPQLLDKLIPTEYIYGCLMNLWYLKQFKGQIGLIGGKQKLDLIKKLLTYKEYQDYLGIDSFNDYIEIPQKFACDNLDYTIEIVKEQLENSNPNTRVYLFGVGHVKSGLIHHLPSFKNAVYIDIGCGIDALAGCIDPDRPLARGWINYRISSYDYSNIDYLQYNVNSDTKKHML